MTETTTNGWTRRRPGRPARRRFSCPAPGAAQPAHGPDHRRRPRIRCVADERVHRKYAKILFVDSGLGLTPPYDLAALRKSLLPGQQPVTRTYTLRRADLQHQQAHDRLRRPRGRGDRRAVGRAGEPGDLLTMSGAGGAYRPDPASDWHLLAGDESALPAICSALEALPGDARGVAYLETSDPGEYLDAKLPGGVEVVWLHRPHPWPPAPVAGRRPAGRVVAGWPGRRFRPRGAGVDEGGPRLAQGPARRRRPTVPVGVLGRPAGPRTCSSPRSASRSGRSSSRLPGLARQPSGPAG